MKKRIVITVVGAESSGKTTLARQLADHFGNIWVPEFARSYLEALGRPYTWEDLDIIAQHELDRINKAIDSDGQPGVIIIDGGMMNIRIWARIRFGDMIPRVETALEKDVTDLYILCRPHRAWEPDPLREAPLILDRAWIYNRYLDELSHHGVRFIICSSHDFFETKTHQPACLDEIERFIDSGSI